MDEAAGHRSIDLLMLYGLSEFARLHVYCGTELRAETLC